MNGEAPKPDIVSETIKDNETWNTCPKCGYSWKDDIATPGLIHRTRLCAKCSEETKTGRL